jgi:two-component system, NarL family, response regulator NreC
LGKVVWVVKIILADDHLMVRRGIKSLLSTESDFNIIGEASGGLETLNLVANLRPDILVLDLMMPDMNGLEVTRRLSKKYPDTSIIILSMHSNEAYVMEALCSGAKAYILKESSSDELVQAIRAVISGHQYLSSSLPANMIETYSCRIEPPQPLRSRATTAICCPAETSGSPGQHNP